MGEGKGERTDISLDRITPEVIIAALLRMRRRNALLNYRLK
jgi:hypothetical protein